MTRTLTRRWMFLLLIGLLLAGCETPVAGPGSLTAPERATLAAVVIEDRLARSDEVARVRVVRDGVAMPAQLGRRLSPGDTVQTDATTAAVLDFEGAIEVILQPDTELALSSIELREGGVLVRIRQALRQVADLITAQRGWFVRTEYVAAGPESTEFFVGYEDTRTTVVVLEGLVRVSSNTQSWPPVLLRQFEQGTMLGSQPPRVGYDTAAFNAIVQWANRIERLIREQRTELLVPAVAGLRLEEAERALATAGLAVGRLYPIVSGQQAAGTVLEQGPAAGVRIPPGGAVDLGIEAPSVRMPVLIDLRREDAERRLRDQGLRIGEVRAELSEGGRSGTVIGQDPAPDELVPGGIEVDLVVAADRETYCAENAGPPPRNAEILQRAGTGPNEIVATNGTSRDALVKFRDLSGRGALIFYVQAGSKAEIGGVPSGTFGIEWLSGHRFSRACGIFLEAMQASRADRTVRLEARGSRHTVYSMTLHPVTGGTVRYRDIPVEEFLRN